MCRVVPLANVVLRVTKYTVFFSVLGVFVIACADAMSSSTTYLRDFLQILFIAPISITVLVLFVGVPLGVMLGVAVAIVLAVLQGDPPSLRRLRFAVELISLLAVLPGVLLVSEWTDSLDGTPARLVVAVGHLLPLLALHWGRKVADKYFSDLRRLEKAVGLEPLAISHSAPRAGDLAPRGPV